MKYLFLDFWERYESVKTFGNSNENYSIPLKDQYETIQHRYGIDSSMSFRTFVAYFFSETMDVNYMISIPALKNRAADDGVANIKNVFIRPVVGFLNFLKPEYDVYFVGDIRVTGNITKIVITGIEFLDSSISRVGEYSIECRACCAFNSRTLSNRDINVADFGKVDYADSVLTNDKLLEIFKNTLPIKNEEALLNTLNYIDKLEDYLTFRKYYVKTLSGDAVEISSVTVCDSYSVSPAIYKDDENKYKSELLDGNEKFAKTDLVMLNRQIGDSTEFPLIRIDIDRRKKEMFEKKDKSGKMNNEAWLLQYSKNSVALYSKPVKYNEEGDPMLGGKISSYRLGDRYLYDFEDLPVDFTDLENKYNEDCRKAEKKIDDEYEGIIRSIVADAVKGKNKEILNSNQTELNEYIELLSASLNKDVSENKDEKVRQKYDHLFKEESEKLNSEILKSIKSVNERIENVRRKRKKTKKAKGDLSSFDTEIASLESEKEELLKKEEENKTKVAESISLLSLYEERNADLISQKEVQLDRQRVIDIEKFTQDKRKWTEKDYEDEKKEKKDNEIRALTNALDEDKANETKEKQIRRYHIYYRPMDMLLSYSAINNRISALSLKYMIYDDSAETAKIRRQEKALDDLKLGNVRNPFLASYLFDPESLDTSEELAEEPEWIISELNDRQHEAVRRALSSKGLFLLQGPPGTGKTQVIAEISAQLAKKGQKVLISSETHKAIDNVFERLPKTPAIRPLRLIPSYNEKETNYDIKKLTDNFYENISGNLNTRIKWAENFEELARSYNERMNELHVEYDKFLRLKKEYDVIDENRNDLKSKINAITIKISEVQDDIDSRIKKQDELKRTRNAIESGNISSADDFVQNYAESYFHQTEELLSSYEVIQYVPVYKAGNIVRADSNKIAEELAELLSDDEDARLNRRIVELKGKMAELRDDITDEPPDECTDEAYQYKKYQNELIQIKNSMGNHRGRLDLSTSLICSFVPVDKVSPDTIGKLPDEMTDFKDKRERVSEEIISRIDEELAGINDERLNFNGTLYELKREKNSLDGRLREIGENGTNVEYRNLETKIRNAINEFFDDFKIIEEYPPKEYDTAFEIMNREFDRLREEYDKEKSNIENLIPVYRDIRKYINQSSVRMNDRAKYTNAIFDCVNVIGITCTSRATFKESDVNDLREFGIEDVDIRRQNIDVVIIDEVSKSFFLDLLIPLLYGKTVVLVGDHRQLPPFYDLKFFKDEEYNSMDNEIINKVKNKEFTKLYETCFFKTLFERIDDSFRIMLNQQYRSHSQIMNVVNHFYKGKKDQLILGKPEQDNEKQHGLTVVVEGRPIVDPDHHVYFVNCNEQEQQVKDSTSYYNQQEADVALKLLELLNTSCLKLLSEGKISRGGTDKDGREMKDTRPSVGVICTYGDQVSKIKKRRKKYDGFSTEQEERFDVRTVDDFQGDERDIVIVSMVRNTSDSHNLDFIRSFERINVAYSRARTMLIILGNRKFLSEKGILKYLPGLSKDEPGIHNYPVYAEIINSIDKDGRILNADDILGTARGKHNGRN